MSFYSKSGTEIIYNIDIIGSGIFCDWVFNSLPYIESSSSFILFQSPLNFFPDPPNPTPVLFCLNFLSFSFLRPLGTAHVLDNNRYESLSKYNTNSHPHMPVRILVKRVSGISNSMGNIVRFMDIWIQSHQFVKNIIKRTMFTYLQARIYPGNQLWLLNKPKWEYNFYSTFTYT